MKLFKGGGGNGYFFVKLDFEIAVGGGGGGSNYIFVHGHQIFAKCTCTKMYKNVQNMFFPVWKFPG